MERIKAAYREILRHQPIGKNDKNTISVFSGMDDLGRGPSEEMDSHNLTQL
jgi:hypothetical protein